MDTETIKSKSTVRQAPAFPSIYRASVLIRINGQISKERNNERNQKVFQG
jgi:hypothetical protein